MARPISHELTKLTKLFFENVSPACGFWIYDIPILRYITIIYGFNSVDKTSVDHPTMQQIVHIFSKYVKFKMTTHTCINEFFHEILIFLLE